MGADAANPAVYGPQTGVHILEAGQIVDLQVINWFVAFFVVLECVD